MVACSGFTPGADILLDFSRVETLSGATLGKLVRLHNVLKASGYTLILCNVAEHVLEIFDVSGLTRVFTTYAIHDACKRYIGTTAKAFVDLSTCDTARR